MSATGLKQLSVSFLNLHCRNVSIKIVAFLFITYVELPVGAKGRASRYRCTLLLPSPTTVQIPKYN